MKVEEKQTNKKTFLNEPPVIIEKAEEVIGMVSKNSKQEIRKRLIPLDLMIDIVENEFYYNDLKEAILEHKKIHN